MAETNAFPSDLDQQQIIQQAYDSSLQRLRVDAEVSAVIGEVVINAATSSVSIGDPNNSNTLAVNSDGTIDVNTITKSTDDNIAIGNQTGTNFLAVNADGSINVTSTGSSTVSGSVSITGGTVSTNLNGLADFQTSMYVVGTSAVQLTPSPLSNRSSVSFKAFCSGSNMIFIGNSSSVTSTTGYPLVNGDSLQLDLTGSQESWAIASAADQNLYVLELG